MKAILVIAVANLLVQVGVALRLLWVRMFGMLHSEEFWILLAVQTLQFIAATLIWITMVWPGGRVSTKDVLLRRIENVLLLTSLVTAPAALTIVMGVLGIG